MAFQKVELVPCLPYIEAMLKFVRLCQQLMHMARIIFVVFF